jgi:diguanylate cyclase (GGDEF)-like protein
MRPSHIDHPRDEAAVADLTSAAMWTASGVIGLAGVALPGSDRGHLAWVAGLFSFAIAWGLASFAFAHGRPLPIGLRAVITALMMPVVALALWATGGASSQVQPLLIFTVLFVAFFHPPRFVWPLVVLHCAAYASPLLYDSRAVAEGYPAQVLAFAAAVAGATQVTQVLKRRLVRAEAKQRAMAECDPLTGLHNRRSFDVALARAIGDETHDARVALVLFDFDGFKAINDVHGHPIGDVVLCSVAEACRSAVREDDCLARLGGDEFGLIVPGAGPETAERIARALTDAIAGTPMPAGLAPVTATFGWAVSPADATDAGGLVRRADQRLLAHKRAGRMPALR